MIIYFFIFAVIEISFFVVILFADFVLWYKRVAFFPRFCFVKKYKVFYYPQTVKPKSLKMPETEVEQQPTANTEAVKEEKKDLVEESTKNEDGSEKKDESEKKEKAEPEKKEKVEKKKVVKEVVPPPPAVHKKDFEKDVVYLYQFNRTAVIPSMSLYCLKVETWLKLNGIKYEVGDFLSKVSL